MSYASHISVQGICDYFWVQRLSDHNCSYKVLQKGIATLSQKPVSVSHLVKWSAKIKFNKIGREMLTA